MPRPLALILAIACSGCSGSGPPTFGVDSVEGLSGTFLAELDASVLCAVGVTLATGPFAGLEPTPTTVWSDAFDGFEETDVLRLPADFNVSLPDTWADDEVWVAAICDSDQDLNWTAADIQGVYGGAQAVAVDIEADGLEIQLVEP